MEKQKSLTVLEAIQVAEQEYGEKFHPNTFYRYLAEGTLKGFRVRKQWRIEPSVLKAFFCPESENQTSSLVGDNQ